MKHFFRFCTEILIGLLCICTLLLALEQSGWFENANRKKGDFQIRHVEENAHFINAEVVFVGNSQTYLLNDSLLESALRASVFTVSRPDAAFNDFRSILDWTDKESSPKIVVLETHVFRKDFRGDEFQMKFPKSFKNFLSLESEWNQFKYFARDVLQYHSVLESGPGWIAEAILRPKEVEWGNGFRRSKYQPIDNAFMENYERTWTPFPDNPIESDILDEVKRFVLECKESGIEVMLYESPWYQKHCMPQINRRSSIEKMAAQCQVLFVDLNQEESLVRDPCFFQATVLENQHLTQEGADTVTVVLAPEIKAMLDLIGEVAH